MKKIFLVLGLLLLPCVCNAEEIKGASTTQYVARYEEMIKQGQFDALDAELQELDLSHKRFTNGHYVFDGFSGGLKTEMAKSPEVYLPQLNKWVASSSASYMPLLIRGLFYRSLAWHERGNGYADSVTEEKWKLFKADIELNHADLIEAYRRNPHSSTVAMELIDAERDLNNTTESLRWFKAAAEAYPDNWVAYSKYMQLLKPQWGGSIEATLYFAREAVASHKDPLFGMLLIDAHSTASFFEKKNGKSIENYYSQPAVWKDLREALEKILAAYPDHNYDRNRLAYFAFQAGAYDIADREFKIIGNNWTDIWTNWEYFQKSRALAAQKNAGIFSNIIVPYGWIFLRVLIAAVIAAAIGFIALRLLRKVPNGKQKEVIVKAEKGDSPLVKILVVILFASIGGIVAQQIFKPSIVSQMMDVRLKDSENPVYAQNNSDQHHNFYDSAGRERLYWGMYNGQPGAIFYADDQARTFSMGFGTYTNDIRSNEKGLPSMVFNDREGRLKWLMRVDGPNQNPLIILKDKNQNPKIYMGVGLASSDEEPFLVYFDKSGTKHSLFGDIDWHP